jgi:hypothetical protein
LVRDVEPISWIDETMIKEARERMAHQEGEWGPMQREPDEPANGSANGHAPRRG